MDNYIFNKNSDIHNRHEIHKDTCKYKPELHNIIQLGKFSNCKEALILATMFYPDKSFDECYYCCPEIHRD